MPKAKQKQAVTETEEAPAKATEPEEDTRTLEEIQADIEVHELSVGKARDALTEVNTADPKALRDAALSLNKAVRVLNADRRVFKRLETAAGKGTGSRAIRPFIRKMLTESEYTESEVEAAVNEKFGEGAFKHQAFNSITHDARANGELEEIHTFQIVAKLEPDEGEKD